MASPFLVIGAFPKLVSFLPKPGAWMDTFKNMMGFVLLGTVVFLLTFLEITYVVPTIAFLIGLFALFYFIAIRPQRKRQKEHKQMVSALGKGDEVVTTSGILGKISSLDDNYIVLSVAEKVELKFQRVHIHAVLPKGTLKSIG